MVGRGAPEPKRSWRAGKTLLARQAHRSENPPASAVGSVKYSFSFSQKHAKAAKESKAETTQKPKAPKAEGRQKILIYIRVCAYAVRAGSGCRTWSQLGKPGRHGQRAAPNTCRRAIPRRRPAFIGSALYCFFVVYVRRSISRDGIAIYF